MIRVDIASALLIYLALFLFLYLGTWLTFHLKNRKRTALPPLYTLCTCEYCHYDYLAQTGSQVSKCPQCQSLNKTKG